MFIDFRYVSYQIVFPRWIQSFSSNSFSMIAHDHRLEAEFCIATHAIHCNHISQRAFESFRYIDYVYDFHQTASPPQVNPTQAHLVNPPQYKVTHHQPIITPQNPPHPHSQPTQQIPPERGVRPPTPSNLLPILDRREEVRNGEDKEAV